MLLNEHEARDRWCHATIGTIRSKCLASECMAWGRAEYIPHVYEKYDLEDTRGNR